MNILVTGASGYIGRDFLTSLSDKYPHSTVYVLVNKTEVILRQNTVVIRKDIRNVSAQDFSVNFTYVYHFAALAHDNFSSDDIEDINVEGTRNLLNALSEKCSHFIFMSSSNVYGDVGKGITENSKTSTSAQLMLAKLKCEELIMASSIKNIMIFRLALVISFDSPGNIKSIRDMINKTSILPFGAANTKRSYLNKYDLVSFLSDIPTNKIQGKHIINLATDEQQSFKDLILKFAHLEDKQVCLFYFPSFIFMALLSILGKKGLYNKLFRTCTIDSTKAKKELGFVSKTIKLRK